MVSALVHGSGPDVISFWPSSGDLVLKLDYRERKQFIDLLVYLPSVYRRPCFHILPSGLIISTSSLMGEVEGDSPLHSPGSLVQVLSCMVVDLQTRNWNLCL